MDPNREPEAALYDNSEDSAIAYNDYHNMIETHFCKNLMANDEPHFSQGLLIDLHGQSHKENWIELGYLITGKNFGKIDLNSIEKKSSMSLLAGQFDNDLEKIIRGDCTSLGSFMQDKFDIRAVPSPNTPSPDGASYYSGGYITDRYTSEEFSKYKLNAVQIELPSSLRDSSCFEDTAQKLAACIFLFYNYHSFSE